MLHVNRRRAFGGGTGNVGANLPKFSGIFFCGCISRGKILFSRTELTFSFLSGSIASALWEVEPASKAGGAEY